MHRNLSFIGTVLLAAVACTSVSAACGGGGYRPAPARHQAVSSDRKSTRDSERVQEVAYKRPETRIYEKRHFDAVSANLDLSSAQRQAVVTLTNESSRRADELQKEIGAAQAKVDVCKSGCEKERAKLSELKGALASLETDVEKQLSRFLSRRQMELYKTGDASADYERFR